MSPKLSRPAGEPDKTGLPPGHVPMRPPASPKPEPRKPIPLWWKLGGYVALLAATVGTIVYFGWPKDPRSSAQGTAELVAKALSDGDISALQSYLCGGTPPESWTGPGVKTVTTVLNVSDEDDHATARLSSRDFRGSRVLTLSLRNRNGSWCVV
jgi:hypothetical protein